MSKVKLIVICDGCGKPWTDADKNDRCWCDPSPSSHIEERLVIIPTPTPVNSKAREEIEQ